MGVEAFKLTESAALHIIAREHQHCGTKSKSDRMFGVHATTIFSIDCMLVHKDKVHHSVLSNQVGN